MWLTLWIKTVFLIFILFYWFDQKHLLKQIQIFLRIYPFSNMVRKRNSLNISVLVSEIVILCLKRKVLYEFLQKCFKTTERQSLAVCGLLSGEKQFLLIFICFYFYWFDQKHLLKQIQIFLRILAILCGEKQFLLIFMRFYWFDQKHLLKQIQIFLCHFSNIVRKTNFWDYQCTFLR